MSSRFTSPFDELLDKNRRELDALYQQGTGPSSRSGRTAAAPTPAAPEPAPATTARDPQPPAGERPPLSAAATAGEPSLPAASPAEHLLNERYGDGWRFEVTSRRRERGEIIVVGTLRLPGTGAVRTQFGSARISVGSNEAASGSAGGVDFSFGGGGSENPLAAEEAAFERAREDALASCAALLQ